MKRTTIKDIFNNELIGRECLVSGWGPRTPKGLGGLGLPLPRKWRQRWVTLEILDNKLCQGWYKKTKSYQWDKTICAHCQPLKGCFMPKGSAIHKVYKHFIMKNKTERSR